MILALAFMPFSYHDSIPVENFCANILSYLSINIFLLQSLPRLAFHPCLSSLHPFSSSLPCFPLPHFPPPPAPLPQLPSPLPPLFLFLFPRPPLANSWQGSDRQQGTTIFGERRSRRRNRFKPFRRHPLSRLHDENQGEMAETRLQRRRRRRRRRRQ